ncbi:Uncharacterized protein BN1090_A2_03812 [Aneurinibacillus migulanus]|nr:Uncharacterized protein BN1090_A2_03812 [Aneurinibacillus migulanus]
MTLPILVDENMRIIPEILDFVDSLQVRGKSVNTIRSYLYDLKLFYVWLKQQGTQFYEIRPENIIMFLRFVDSTPNKRSPASINRMLATLSSFYRHHKSRGGWVVESPIIKVKGKWHPNHKGFLRHLNDRIGTEEIHYWKRKIPKRLDKKRLFPDDVQTFYRAIDLPYKKNESLAFRNKLIFRTLYHTGMRIGELLHLQVTDYDLPDPTKKTGDIYLIARDEPDPDRQLKTGERNIPVASGLIGAIDRYIVQHRPYVEGNPYIFVSHRDGNPLTRNAVEKMFREVSKQCSIKCTPHSLRHTHASELADASIDPLVIKDRLGHGSINTSAKYTEISLETRRRSYERYLIAGMEADLID